MAYLADDTFLPSWGSGMRPREPMDGEESSAGFEEYPPKPKMSGQTISQVSTQASLTHRTSDCLYVDAQPVDDSQTDQLNSQMDQPSEYGTMVDRAMPQTAEKDMIGWATPETTEKVFHRKARKLDRVRMAEKSLFLLWWPAFLGGSIVAVYGLAYWQHPLLAHTVLALSITVASAMLLIAFNGGWAGRASATFMAVNGFCIVSIALVSVFLGVYGFQSYTKSYEIYRGSRYYENIAPNINPGAHRDGGVIKFASGSRVDVEHSIGIRNGDFYCAAPIVFPDSNGFSGFWAVGMNCCNARGGFRCGDVSEPQVRSGLTVLDEDLFTPEEIPQYMKAAAEAAAQFGIGIPTKPMFVRWSSDVDLDKDRYYHDAVGFVISSVAGLFCFMLVIVVMLSSTAMGSSDGFANAYYSVDMEDVEPSRRGKKMRKARHAPDPFMDNC